MRHAQRGLGHPAVEVRLGHRFVLAGRPASGFRSAGAAPGIAGAMIPLVIRHALAPVVPSAAASLDLPRTISTGEAAVALTFDDGPHPEGTPAVLEALARANARATFFVVVEQVQRRPALVAEIAAAGHAVGLHGYRHRLQLRVGTGELGADIERGVESIREAAGVDVAWHRPPYGIYSPAGLRLTRRAG